MWRRGLAAAIVVVALDQLSKAAILARFAGQPFAAERITPIFNLVLTYNRGMSFGLFNDGGALNVLIFSLVAAIIVLLLFFWLLRITSPLLALAIGFIIGGAGGNVIDRLRFGAVVDFLDFHLGAHHWPAFNLADSAISVGVVAMLIDGLLLHKEAH